MATNNIRMGDVDGRPHPLCQHEDCDAFAIECVAPAQEGERTQVEAWYCCEHAQAHGYCWGCGEFYPDAEAFHCSTIGLCEECQMSGDYAGDWDWRKED